MRTLFTRGARASRLLPLLVGAAIVAAACGVTATPSPSVAPSASPAASAAASPSAAVDFHADPALEARLPDSIGGVTMSKLSMSGPDFLAAGSASGASDLQSMLQQLGKTTADLAIAETYDPTAGSNDQAAIFQVKGADPVKLLSLWVAAQTALTKNRTRVTNVVVGGRTVTRLEDFTSDPSRVSYAWSSGDSIVIVRTKSETIVAEVLTKIGS